MIISYDVGSMPFEDDEAKFLKDASLSILSEQFKRKIVQSFIDKIEAGIDIPNYPQYRDMNEMFLEMIAGAVKTGNGYTVEGTLSLKSEHPIIAEMNALRLNFKELSEKVGKPVKIKMCITGPYTLSSLFTYPAEDILIILATLLVKIIQENVFKEKHAEVTLLSVDEPLLGVVDDARLDFGSPYRELLINALETIFNQAKSKGLTTAMHLHNTTHNLLWQIPSLKVIDSHVNDPFYTSTQAKKLLGETDKLVKASIAITNFDKLIEQKTRNSLPRTASMEEKIGEAWKNIKHGKIDSQTFLEDVSLMEKRLDKIIKHFGAERVAYAGPECGLKGFPNYKTALECLKRVSQAVKNTNKRYH